MREPPPEPDRSGLFGGGCASTGKKADELIAAFRNSYNPRIAVTVDMIATGTDVKPLECVFFMCSVRSRTRHLVRVDAQNS